MTHEAVLVSRRAEVADRVASKLWGKALKAFSTKPGFKEAKRLIDAGVDGFITFNSDLGNISGSFMPASETNSFVVTRVWTDKDGLHRESTNGVAERPIFGFWKFFDLASLSYERDGVTVFDRDAASGSEELIEKVRIARALPIETAQPTSAS